MKFMIEAVKMSSQAISLLPEAVAIPQVGYAGKLLCESPGPC